MLSIEGREYFRFMDFFYLPKPPHDLDSEEIVKLCDLRIKYFSQVVDIDLNKSVVACMAEFVKSHLPAESTVRLRVLDFGCGPGVSLDLIASQLEKIDLCGVDMSEKAILSARQRYSNISLIKNKEPLPYDSEFFDVIFALFVFHFRIELLYLSEIWRILKYNGIFIYNTYNIEPSELQNSLLKAGFDNIDRVSGCELPQNFSIYACIK